MKVGLARKSSKNVGQLLVPELGLEKLEDKPPSRGLGSGLAEAVAETAMLRVIVAAGAVEFVLSRASRLRRLISS